MGYLLHSIFLFQQQLRFGMNPLLDDLFQFKDLQCNSTPGSCTKFREDIQYYTAVVLSKAFKKYPHVKQNITMPLPVGSTEDGGHEWLLSEDTMRQLVADLFTAPEKQIPALRDESSHVHTQKWLSLCPYCRVIMALSC